MTDKTTSGVEAPLEDLRRASVEHVLLVPRQVSSGDAMQGEDDGDGGRRKTEENRRPAGRGHLRFASVRDEGVSQCGEMVEKL